MRGIKIPQYEFALKMQGGLMCEGGVFAGHYGMCIQHGRCHIFRVHHQVALS